MKKAKLISIIIFIAVLACLCFFLLRLLLLSLTMFESSLYRHPMSHKWFLDHMTNFDLDAFLSWLNLLVMGVLSYLLYAVSKDLASAAQKEQLSEVKESALSIFYALRYGIEQLIDCHDGKTVTFRGSLLNSEIKHIAILSDRLPDALIPDLHDVFFRLSRLEDEGDQVGCQKVIDAIFETTDGLSKENYERFFHSKIATLYDAIRNLTNTEMW